MEGHLKNSLLAVCRALGDANVQYMLVGGTAVALHGYYRHSIDSFGELTDKPDIDVWYNPTYDNYFNLLKAIAALGQDTAEFEQDQTPEPRKSFFRLDFDAFTCDILPRIKAPIRFVEADRRKAIVDVDEIQIHFMSYSDLLIDKEATARKKDLEDIEQLKKLKGAE